MCIAVFAEWISVQARNWPQLILCVLPRAMTKHARKSTRKNRHGFNFHWTRVEGCTFLSARNTSSPLLNFKTKTGGFPLDASCKNSSNDFLRRHYPHQVKGSKFTYFLSACQHKLPCIYFVKDYISDYTITQDNFIHYPVPQRTHHKNNYKFCEALLLHWL